MDRVLRLDDVREDVEGLVTLGVLREGETLLDVVVDEGLTCGGRTCVRTGVEETEDRVTVDFDTELLEGDA